MTNGRGDATTVARAAQAWLEGNRPSLPAGARAAAPLALTAPSGSPAGWFVPVVADDRLIAFVRFAASLACEGASSFLSGSGGTAVCPLAADWLDRERIRSRARTLATPGEVAGEPSFSFDGSREHFAWRVPLSVGGQRRWVFVAGATAWPERTR